MEAFVWLLRPLGLASAQEDEFVFPLLALPSNCIVNHLVPVLDAGEKASLSLTCASMAHLMAGSVNQLRLDGRGMCDAARSTRLPQVRVLDLSHQNTKPAMHQVVRARADSDACHLPAVPLQLSNVRVLRLTMHSWHDIGFGAPRLLLHLSTGLAHVEDVVLMDQSAAEDYEPLGTPTQSAMSAAAANLASSLWTGVCRHREGQGRRGTKYLRMTGGLTSRCRMHVCACWRARAGFVFAPLLQLGCRLPPLHACICRCICIVALTAARLPSPLLPLLVLPGGQEQAHCKGCGYEEDRTDLSCVLISVLALFPRVKRLEVYTKVCSRLGACRFLVCSD